MTSLPSLLQEQRQFLASGQTQPVSFRIEQLKRLKQAIASRQTAILDALHADLNKPAFEGYLTEIRPAWLEIGHALQQVRKWVRPKSVRTSLEFFPASAQIYPEPLGAVLIISPWNYPFSLCLTPLTGAIAAGNCAILKPSEMAPATSAILAEMVGATFDRAYVAVVEGGGETSQQLLAEKFDHIFFTGSPPVGQRVMEAAARHLTPVTLELGGKSPCIVDTDIDLQETAKRIAWGKFLNAGQTCVAPDYLLVERSLSSALTESICQCLQGFYGPDPAASPDYPRIISDRHFQRLAAWLGEGKILTGGETRASDRYIAPTLMAEVPLDSPLMQEEIFGPILPAMEYTDLEEAIAFVNSRPKPLALYFFSNDRSKQQRVLQATSSGGVCLNDTILHLGVMDLPFGGVGRSGFGSYHGQASFNTFSHYKSVLRKSFRFEFNLRYPPYRGKMKFVEGWLGR